MRVAMLPAYLSLYLGRTWHGAISRCLKIRVKPGPGARASPPTFDLGLDLMLRGLETDAPTNSVRTGPGRRARLRETRVTYVASPSDGLTRYLGTGLIVPVCERAKPPPRPA